MSGLKTKIPILHTIQVVWVNHCVCCRHKILAVRSLLCK